MKNFTDWGIRIRKNPELNYYSIWHNLKTVRLDLGPTMELKPERSEFYDVGLGTKCNLSCHFCLTRDTKVIKGGSWHNIADLRVGDKVNSFSLDRNSIESRPISQIFEREYEGELITIELDNGQSLNITPNHKVYTTNRGWIAAGELNEDDNLLDYEEIRKP